MKTTQEMVNYLTNNGYIIDKSITGYFRLFERQGDGLTRTILDDPGEADYYDFEMAVYLFYSYVTGYYE